MRHALRPLFFFSLFPARAPAVRSYFKARSIWSDHKTPQYSTHTPPRPVVSGARDTGWVSPKVYSSKSEWAHGSLMGHRCYILLVVRYDQSTSLLHYSSTDLCAGSLCLCLVLVLEKSIFLLDIFLP
jgi:hypothetical protein